MQNLLFAFGGNFKNLDAAFSNDKKALALISLRKNNFTLVDLFLNGDFFDGGNLIVGKAVEKRNGGNNVQIFYP